MAQHQRPRSTPAARAVRVSSPDRVIYEATEHTPEVTKLMVAEYYRARRRRAHARAARPADRAGALALGRPPGHEAGHRPQDRTPTRSTRSGCPRARPTTSRPSTITFPSGRTADEICPTEIAVPVWCAHMGTLTFHPWPVRRDDVDRPDELRIDLDPQPRHGVPRRGPGRRGRARAARGARPAGLPQDQRQPRRPRLRAHRAALGVRRRPARRDRRSAASSSGATTGSPPPGGRRSGASGSSSTSTRTAATAPSPRRTRLRPIPGAPVLDADELGRARRGRPTRAAYNLFTRARAARRRATRGPRIDDVHHDLDAAAASCSSEQGVGGADLPARLPEDAGRAAAGAAEQEGRRALGLSSAVSGAAGSPGPDRLHSTAPLTRAWARVTFQPSARRTVFEMSNRGVLRQPVQP